MKKLFVLCLFVSFYTACSTNTTKPLTASPEPALEGAYSAQADLLAKIDKLPRLRVDGYGHNMKVSSCPYFILNGIESGNNLFDVCQLVAGKKIKKVELPRGRTVYRSALLEQRNYIIIDTE